ncbi:MAG: hypothetical protein GXP50_03435 [Deltaproteobacteria bacterium]|nr:hypothetical protein [Deltaproteobacteria bacterium]
MGAGHRVRAILAGALTVLLAGCAGAPQAPPGRPALPPVQGGATTGPLRIERVEITFPNGFGSITVPKGGRLTARAVIRCSGNGAFRADWVVDGRVVETVTRTVAYGTTFEVTTSRDALPTFEPGPHTVTLLIREPEPGFDLPVVRYFVVMQ